MTVTSKSTTTYSTKAAPEVSLASCRRLRCRSTTPETSTTPVPAPSPASPSYGTARNLGLRPRRAGRPHRGVGRSLGDFPPTAPVGAVPPSGVSYHRYTKPGRYPWRRTGFSTPPAHGACVTSPPHPRAPLPVRRGAKATYTRWCELEMSAGKPYHSDRRFSGRSPSPDRERGARMRG